jgi:arylsulfatase B/arylsulfatase I/J
MGGLKTFAIVVWVTLAATLLTTGSDGQSIDVGGSENKTYVTIYESNVDSGSVFYKGTDNDFDSYVSMDKVQTVISAANEAYSTATIDSNILDVSSDEAVAAIKAKGWVYPWKSITAQDELDAHLGLEQVYNTQEGDYESVPNIVFINFDDLGWNNMNLGDLDSTQFSEVFPNVDRLVKQGGITLTNYVTGVWCTPGRTMFLTGKQSSLRGTDVQNAQIAISDATIGHEMQSAGYKTGIIGKWGVGSDHPYIIPANKGFDTFFGFTSVTTTKTNHEATSYESLRSEGVSIVDFWDGEVFQGTDSEYDGIWQTFIYNEKTQDFINEAAESDDGAPFFLYYASDLPHIPFEVPDDLTGRCASLVTIDSDTDTAGMCQTLAAVDEVLANITCAIDAVGQLDNTLFVLASDNGGYVTDDNYPFRGTKFNLGKGGYSAPAAIFGSLVPEELRGTNYDGIFHVTDWIPTLMHAATNGQWTGSVVGDDLDGVDMWGAVMGADGTKPRTDALVYVDGDGYMCVVVDMDDYVLSYHNGAIFQDIVPTENTVKVSGEDRAVCDVDEIEFGESTISVVVSDLLGLAASSPSSWPAMLGACTVLSALALFFRSYVMGAAAAAALKQKRNGDKAAVADGATYGSV